MSSADLLASPPLEVSPAEAAAILDGIYGLDGEVTPLPGERDRNFLVTAASGVYSLKIANPAERIEALDMQQRALCHAREWDPGLPLATPVATREGQLAVTATVSETTVPVRLTTYLPGTTVDEATYNPALRAHTMETLARLDRALRTFSHPEMARPLLWNLTQALGLRPHLEYLSGDKRNAIADWLRHFEAGVKPRLDSLRTQPIHGDFNPANLIVAPAMPERLAGVVDFGDMNRAPLVVDVAVAAAYQCMHTDDPAAHLAAAAGAYHAEAPLDAEEIGLVADLAITRLAQSLLISAWRSVLYPDNRDYILVHATPVWETLQRLIGIDLYELREQIAAACESVVRGEADSTVALQRRRARLGPGMRLTYDRPLHVASGEGVWLIDTAGVRHLDAYNNVAHVGHSHPEVVKALASQAARLNTNTRYLVDEVTAYADRLAALFPEPLEVVYFANSGSEANDLAWRMARTVTGRRGMVVTDHAYHGSTYLTMATSPEELGLENLEDWVATIPAPGPGLDPSPAIAGAVSSLAANGDSIAAYACDTVFSSDGILVPDDGYLASLCDDVRAAGGLCIADEIQAGFGRVGARMWGFAGQGFIPDIVTLGKPMGNGHPLAAVITTKAIADEFSRTGYYFSTFAGNPVSAAVGTAVLDVMEKQRLPEAADRVGAYLRLGLQSLAASYPAVVDVRGPGLFIGVEMGTRDLASRVQNEMRNRQVLIGRTGPGGNVLKIRPPLVFTEKHSDVLLDTLGAILGEF